jgi:hypothetical protein
MLACALMIAASGAAFAGGGAGTGTPPPPPPPALEITDFNCKLILGNSWKFWGTVEDNDGSTNITVTFGGLPSVQGLKVPVQPDGSFILIVTLGRNETGIATAVATDDEGQTSDIADTFVF